ncbi:lipoprotein [Spiroplasma endosymbiont of Ammophila pubescens]|uniref:lipoprotein n=1 Tax=Spiroplasma endosymbiont of Ammophila pubescens TaxID=3066315 RepID=UPI0032B1608E
MKRLLSFIGTIILIGTSTTNLVACNKTQYSEDDLKKEKEKHKIDTANQEIKNNLEWIAPQEKPFNTVDSKYYIVVARNSLNSDWKIFKLKNNGEKGRGLKTDWGERPVGWIFTSNGIYLATGNLLDTSMKYVWGKNKKYENYIKSVYRWNLNKNIPSLAVNNKTGEIAL